MNTATRQTVTLPVQVDKQYLLEGILGSCWWTWEWWGNATFAKGCDSDTYPESDDAPYVTIVGTHPDDEYLRPITKTLTVGDLLNATAHVLAHHPHVQWDDLDACAGDLIMQTAFYGEVIYA